MEPGTFNKNKLASGRYALCQAAVVLVLMLGYGVMRVMTSTIGEDDPQVHPIVLTALTAIVTFISGTVGFYFGQNSKPKG